MKYILRILLFCFFGLVAYGYYLKNSGNIDGDKWVGLGVLLLALIIMPLFIYHRYKNKNLKDYELNLNSKKSEESDSQ